MSKLVGKMKRSLQHLSFGGEKVNAGDEEDIFEVEVDDAILTKQEKQSEAATDTVDLSNAVLPDEKLEFGKSSSEKSNNDVRKHLEERKKMYKKSREVEKLLQKQHSSEKETSQETKAAPAKREAVRATAAAPFKQDDFDR